MNGFSILSCFVDTIGLVLTYFIFFRDMFGFGKKHYGVALGGGATRGFIHIGVLRYIEENNIRISSIAGTSMGSIVAALVATGKSSSEIYDIFDDISYTDILDFDFKTGIMKGEKIMDELKNIFGDLRMDDLDIPLTIVATDLKTGKEVVFDSGLVVEAIRYSISVPAVFSVYDIGKSADQLLVDGGLVNNLPVDHLHEKNVIAVSAMGIGEDFTVTTPIRFLGFEFGRTKLGFQRRVLVRSIHIMLRQIEDMHLMQRSGVRLVRPFLHGITGVDLDALDKAIELGYNEAKAVLG